MAKELRCFPPEGIVYDARDGFPFSAQRPLLFHVLTDYPEGMWGEEYALELVSRGAALAPAISRGRRSMIRARDALAGDDEYLFLTPLQTFSTTRSTDHLPAFAFDAISLWAASTRGFRFRVRDIEDVYSRIEQNANPEAVSDILSHKIDEDDFLALNKDEQESLWEEARASVVSEELQCAAVEGTTIVDPRDALDFLTTYAALAEADGEPTLALIDKLYTLVPKVGTELWDWCPLAEKALRESRIDEAWEKLIEDASSGELFGWGSTPEVLYPGTVPLCCAAFFRNAKHEWVKLKEYSPLACKKGRKSFRSANPLVLKDGK